MPYPTCQPPQTCCTRAFHDGAAHNLAEGKKMAAPRGAHHAAEDAQQVEAVEAAVQEGDREHRRKQHLRAYGPVHMCSTCYMQSRTLSTVTKLCSRATLWKTSGTPMKIITSVLLTAHHLVHARGHAEQAHVHEHRGHQVKDSGDGQQECGRRWLGRLLHCQKNRCLTPCCQLPAACRKALMCAPCW